MLARVIERSYAATGVRLGMLADSGESIYQVGRTAGPGWVLRVCPPDGSGSANTLAAMLLFLGSRDQPTKHVVRAMDGSAFVSHASGHLLVTTFLGEPL